MPTAQARTQWPKKPQPDLFHDFHIEVDRKGGTVKIVLGNMTAGLDYFATRGLIARLEQASRLIEPPVPTGRTYNPKASTY